MLNSLNSWCAGNNMKINPSKSNVVHFRPPSVPRCNTTFVCGNAEIPLTDRYKYLGLVLTEHLDYAITAKVVAQSANRALGLVIAKTKSFGGLSYSVFTKLYESVVCPVITYGAAIWGTEDFSCINSVQYRAARFFLHVNKHTANAAVSGDIGWTPMECRLWKVIGTFWSRLANMSVERINKRSVLWAKSKSSTSCRNWPYRVQRQFLSFGLEELCNMNVPMSKSVILMSLLPVVLNNFIRHWKEDLNRVSGKTGIGGNKLRTYRLFKHDFETEIYCKNVWSAKHRGAIAKFRTGTAPIRLETGRYESLPVSQRKCFNCDCVENEEHVLVNCPLYDDIRFELFNKCHVCMSRIFRFYR